MEERDEQIYKVVVNHEEQYSIWRADRPNPPGWNDEGTRGPREDCLAHIERIWTDMRPLSLRRQIAVSSEATAAPVDAAVRER
jgi:MbtH protein